jgi:ubiquinone/menaquinone biosynthesis C-methylase UbiE
MNDAGNDQGVVEWDESYSISESLTLWGEPAVPYVLEIAPRLGALGGHVLELPCGDGRNTIPLAGECGSVLAADSSGRALGLAAARLQGHAVSNVALLECNVFQTPFFDDQLAGILCWDLLGHLRRPQKALAELSRISRPGGLIVANVFALGDETRGDQMQSIGHEEYIYQERLYFHFYDEGEARSLASAVVGTTLVDLQLTRWTEPPHEGYREYKHEHESWVFTLEVDA